MVFMIRNLVQMNSISYLNVVHLRILEPKEYYLEATW